MPEGHTLHRLARLHQRRFAGAPVSVSSPQGRFTEGAAAVNGRTFVQAHAWGKHLFHDYGPVGVVHVHLGLYGAFTELPVPMGLPVGQVRMRIEGASSAPTCVARRHVSSSTPRKSTPSWPAWALTHCVPDRIRRPRSSGSLSRTGQSAHC